MNEIDTSKQYVANLSYGKDSIAMLHVITDILHWPLDKIITADVWATDTIPADMPPMVEFKSYADSEIKKRWGIEVEHVTAIKNGEPNNYQKQFYAHITEKRIENRKKEWSCPGKCYNPNGKIEIHGFPLTGRPWCNDRLKTSALDRARKMYKGSLQYIGIAYDEGERTERHKAKVEANLELLPLVEAQWTESMCREWCEQNNLLSPIYTTYKRGGCWFCHNQGIDALRSVRNDYPNLWNILLQWDNDSPVTFKSNGHTVHDYERRFKWEEEGYKPTGNQFRWTDTEEAQMNISQFLDE